MLYVATPQPNLLALLPLVVGIYSARKVRALIGILNIYNLIMYISAVNDWACVVIMVQLLCNHFFSQDFPKIYKIIRFLLITYLPYACHYNSPEF